MHDGADNRPVDETSDKTSNRSGRHWWPVAWLFVLYWLLVAPVILSGRGGPSEARDQDRHHLVVIETMLEQWPDVDIVDYASATSPGYHLALAGVNRAVSGGELNTPALRWTNALLSMGLLLVVFGFASRRVTSLLASVLCLPLLVSPYFLGAAIYLTTDNAALLFVAIALGGAIFLPRRPLGDLGLGLAALCAVGVRQIHAWVAGPVGFVGLLASPLALRLPIVRSITGPEPLCWGRLTFGAIAGLLPLALLAWFVWLWGGLMPPAYVDMHNSGVNLATPTFALALLGVFGVCFAPMLDVQWRTALRSRGAWLACAGALALAFAFPTSFMIQERAYGALWRLVEKAPAVADRSLLLAPLACVGAIIIVAIARSAAARGHRREIVVLLLAMLGWTLAQSFNSMAWQRYFEPMLLIFLCFSSALGARSDALAPSRRWLGVGALSAALAALSALSLYREVIEAGAPG